MKKYLKKLTWDSMTGRKTRFDLKLKLFALFIVGTIGFMSAVSTGLNPVKTAITTMAISPFVVLGKKEEELTDTEKSAFGTMVKVVDESFKELSKGLIDKDSFDAKMKEMQEQLKELSPEGKFGNSIKELQEMRDTVKSISETVEKLKSKGFQFASENNLQKQIGEIIDSDKFKDWVSSDKSKRTGRFTLKDLTSFENSYTGDKLTTQQSGVVSAKINETRINLRDLMMVDTGDQTFTSITFTQIYNLDRGAAFQSENGRLPGSSFKAKEVTAEIARVGTYVPISKRMLRSRTYVESFLMNRLPKWVRMAEDFQILFGDGTGANLKGITKYEDVKCVSKIITDAVYTGAAGCVKEVSSYDGGAKTMVEFVDAHDMIQSGQKITFAGISTTPPTIINTFDVYKVTDRKIVIDLAFASLTTGQIGALTVSVKNNFFNTIEDPNMRDAINAIFAVLTYAEYSPNVIALNPSTVFEISALKDTTGRDLNLVERRNGVAYISGRPVVETTAIMPGRYFAGDMINGVSLTDVKAVSIEFVEGVEEALTNSTNLIVDEEVIMPVYNPFAFAYGKLSDVLTAITAA